MPPLSAFFSRRWRWATLAVVLGVLFLVRLGFWQLDRLEWRRGENVQKAAEMNATPLPLNQLPAGVDLPAMWNRQATAVGEYDPAGQFIVRSQNYQGQPGGYLLAPLRLAGSDTAVIIHRGWLPTAELDRAPTYHQPGSVTVSGRIQRTETLSGGRVTEITADNQLYRIDLAAIEAHLGYPILPIYLLEEPPPPPDTELPYQLTADLSLSEGDHLSYAIQWFLFAPLLAVIYGYLVAKSAPLKPDGS